MTDRLPLTLVLVSYNKADVIALAIESVARGSVRPDLVVLSDDGSTDGTPEVAEEALRKCGLRYRILRHLRVARYRLQTMRNAAVANALDGAIMVSDSDCIFGHHSLESHYAIHQTPMRVGTGPRYEYLEGSNGPFQNTFYTLECSHFQHGLYVVPVGANLSFRKSLWRLIGGFDRAYEGSYGMDEYDFSLRAQRAGAQCYSDPGAYIFHIPHDTIFGGRSATRNIKIFDRGLRHDHAHQEWYYITRRVIPSYLRGNRKQPLLGDKVALDEWGAPAGFVPPPHFEFVRSRAALIEVVDEFVQKPDWSVHPKIWKRLGSLNPWLVGKTTPAAVMIEELRWALDNIGNLGKLTKRLTRWRDAAKALEAQDLRPTEPAPQERQPSGAVLP
ncbi:MAG: glycosyltransferase family A protein [Planctomycetota bacterium]